MDSTRHSIGNAAMSNDNKSLLSLLLPPVAYDSKQSGLSAELTAEGNVFNTTEALAKKVINGITPVFAGDLLGDWERVLGVIPNNTEMSYQQRLEIVMLKLSETGGLSITYFKNLASRLGYSIDIVEQVPFYTGINRCGDRLMAHDVIWTWGVVISGLKVKGYFFRTGASVTGERLSTFADTVIETTFNNLKPAHTFCYFIYQDN